MEQLQSISPITIAIDGHSSCGKSTLAKALAQHLNYIYVDTGAMYRAVTLFSIQNKLWLDAHTPDAEALRKRMSQIIITFRRHSDGTLHTYLNNTDVEREIRSMEVSEKVSPISTIDFVRHALVKQQQAMGREKGVVMDGRDIGTTVFPYAELKIFLTASAEVRAQRRYLELQTKGTPSSFDKVLDNLLERDRIDSSRSVSPLRQAEDAIVIDNSNLTIQQQNDQVFMLAEECIRDYSTMGKVEIDAGSGFCFGVVTAIRRAEEELSSSSEELYCLGDIVHNTGEVERLGRMGLRTIDNEQYYHLQNKRVFIRAHGEPPATYHYAKQNNLTIVDATCPVVLKLQERIRNAYEANQGQAQIVILGKRGHAEVNGLVGQTNGTAIVIQNEEEIAENVDLNRDIILFAQTTMGLELFDQVINTISQKIASSASFLFHDTICRQVSKRIPNIMDFAAQKDRVFFIAGAKSSNGLVLFTKCKEANEKSFFVSDVEQLTLEMVPSAFENIGVCGATSTPTHQMEALAHRIRQYMRIQLSKSRTKSK